MILGGYVILSQRVASRTPVPLVVHDITSTSTSTSTPGSTAIPGEITEQEVIEAIRGCEVLQIQSSGSPLVTLVELKDKRQLKLVGPAFYGVFGFTSTMKDVEKSCGLFPINSIDKVIVTGTIHCKPGKGISCDQ